MKGGDCLAMVVGSIQQRRVDLLHEGLGMGEACARLLEPGR